MTQYIYNDLIQTKAAGPIPEGALPLSEILQALEIAKDIDWASILKLLENKENDLAVLTTIEDFLKLISPFVPQAAIGVGAIGLLILILNNSHPVNPNTYPGYHWDPLWGWVPNEEETK